MMIQKASSQTYVCEYVMSPPIDLRGIRIWIYIRSSSAAPGVSPITLFAQRIRRRIRTDSPVRTAHHHCCCCGLESPSLNSIVHGHTSIDLLGSLPQSSPTPAASLVVRMDHGGIRRVAQYHLYHLASV
jgi:hypothetical protein